MIFGEFYKTMVVFFIMKYFTLKISKLPFGIPHSRFGFPYEIEKERGGNNDQTKV